MHIGGPFRSCVHVGQCHTGGRQPFSRWFGMVVGVRGDLVDVVARGRGGCPCCRSTTRSLASRSTSTVDASAGCRSCCFAHRNPLYRPERIWWVLSVEYQELPL